MVKFHNFFMVEYNASVHHQFKFHDFFMVEYNEKVH